MNRNIEKEIVRYFVAADKQERILWELSSERKREDVFWRFSGSQVFNSKCLRPISCMQADVMEAFLLEQFKSENVYFLGESYIGELKLKEAVKKASAGEICIIYSENGIGYYQGEQEFGSSPRFLLLRKKEIV